MLPCYGFFPVAISSPTSATCFFYSQQGQTNNIVNALMKTHWQKFEKLEDMRKFCALLLASNNLYSWKPLSWEHRWRSWILACYPKMRPLSTGPHSPHREDDLFWRIKFPFPRRRNIHCNKCAHNAPNNAACAAEYKIWISNARGHAASLGLIDSWSGGRRYKTVL